MVWKRAECNLVREENRDLGCNLVGEENRELGCNLVGEQNREGVTWLGKRIERV